MHMVDAIVKAENRGKHGALSLTLFSFPSTLHIAFSGKILCSANGWSLFA